MKLYVVRVIGDWDPWYDKAVGFVVRAKSPRNARKLASENAGDEGAKVWLDTDLTSCEELKAEGDEEVIIRDFEAA